MSCIWVETPAQGWRSVPLASHEPLAGDAVGAAGIAFLDLRQGALLMSRPGTRVRVNGQPVVGGVRVLDHKDEITSGPAHLHFSAESTPQIVVHQLAAGARPVTCPICRGPIRDGMTAVQCPGCSRWFHQADGDGGKPCWTYAPTCRFCNHPTAFGVEAAWRPATEDARD